MVEVNLQTVVANNRAPISLMGSGLGTQFFQVDPRESWPNHAEDKARVIAEGNVELIVNRSPMRYRMVGKDIMNVSIETNVSGQAVLVINKHADNCLEADVTIPIGKDMSKCSAITKEALKQALHGDKSKIFADPQKLATVLNDLNRQEIARIDGLINILQKAKQGCESAITENEKKATDYKAEVVKSEPQIDLTGNGCQRAAGLDGVVVNVHTDE